MPFSAAYEELGPPRSGTGGSQPDNNQNSSNNNSKNASANNNKAQSGKNKKQPKRVTSSKQQAKSKKQPDRVTSPERVTSPDPATSKQQPEHETSLDKIIPQITETTDTAEPTPIDAASPMPTQSVQSITGQQLLQPHGGSTTSASAPPFPRTMDRLFSISAQGASDNALEIEVEGQCACTLQHFFFFNGP